MSFSGRCANRHHGECRLVGCLCKCHVSLPVTLQVHTPTQATQAKGCPGHSQAHLVFTVKGESQEFGVYAGSKQSGTVIPAGATVLDLADLARPSLRVEGFELPGIGQRRIVFDWPDMSTPPLSKDQWVRIADGLARRGESVYVACMGGHGRTGTALAILGCLWGVIPAELDPVTWLRDRYCPRLVETHSQIQYVTSITGRTVTAKSGHQSYTHQGGHQKPHWPDGMDLAMCKYAPGHSGCEKLGHVPGDRVKVAHNPVGTFSGATTDRCSSCHAYMGHFSNCPNGGTNVGN